MRGVQRRWSSPVSDPDSPVRRTSTLALRRTTGRPWEACRQRGGSGRGWLDTRSASWAVHHGNGQRDLCPLGRGEAQLDLGGGGAGTDAVLPRHPDRHSGEGRGAGAQDDGRGVVDRGGGVRGQLPQRRWSGQNGDLPPSSPWFWKGDRRPTRRCRLKRYRRWVRGLHASIQPAESGPNAPPHDLPPDRAPDPAQVNPDAHPIGLHSRRWPSCKWLACVARTPQAERKDGSESSMAHSRW